MRVADSHPIKAKWVHVELRRIEILPGGGQANSFSDVVRGGSFNVWSAKGEWEAITAVRIFSHHWDPVRIDDPRGCRGIYRSRLRYPKTFHLVLHWKMAAGSSTNSLQAYLIRLKSESSRGKNGDIHSTL